MQSIMKLLFTALLVTLLFTACKPTTKQTTPYEYTPLASITLIPDGASNVVT